MIEQIRPLLPKTMTREVVRYLQSGAWLIEYGKTREFESKISQFLGVKHCVLTTSGTVALSLACMACMIHKKQKDNLILVPDFTMVGTVRAITLSSGVTNTTFARLVDVEEESFCMDAELIRKLVREKPISCYVRGIIYVSINGRCGDIESIKRVCREQDWFFIEDACQSFGSKHNDQYLGTFGDIGCFSLSPQKIITSGQGGIVVTNDGDLDYILRKLKDQGRVKPGVDEFNHIGFNFKYTDLQAIVGMSQLEDISWRINRKKEIYDIYYEFLKDCNLVKIKKNHEDTVPWFIDVLCVDRQSVMLALKKNKVGYRIFYPPLHTQDLGSFVCKDDDYSTANIVSNQGLWLPSHFELTTDEIGFICDVIKGSGRKLGPLSERNSNDITY